MKTFALSAYILAWPLMALIILAVIVTATVRDLAQARREGRDVV